MAHRFLLLALVGLAVGALAVLWIELGRATDPDPARSTDSRVGTLATPAPVSLAAADAETRQPAKEVAEGDDSAEKDSASRESAELLVLLTDGKDPVGPATLRMLGTLDETPATQEVDALTGEAFFTGLETGYQEIEILTLPRGWILPSTDASERGIGRRVDLSPGSNVCEIRLERAARVFGRVLGPDGEPLDATSVQLTRFDGHENPGHESTLWFAVEGGSYQGYVHDGVWSAQVVGLGPLEPGRTRDPSLRDLVPPPPQVRKLRAGSTSEMDFVCDRFSGVIEGRVLDETNRPFGGLQLVARRITTMTEPESGRSVTIAEDAGRDLSTTEGSFEFPNLGRGSYRIQVDTRYFFAVGPPGINGIGAPVEPVDVTFGAEPRLRVQIAARRSHMVRVRGSLALRGRALAALNVTPSIFLNSRAGGFHRDTVRSWVDGANGQFDFYVESAVEDPCLEVTIDGERAMYPLTLDPEIETTQLVLRFPN